MICTGRSTGERILRWRGRDSFKHEAGATTAGFASEKEIEGTGIETETEKAIRTRRIEKRRGEEIGDDIRVLLEALIETGGDTQPKDRPGDEGMNSNRFLAERPHRTVSRFVEGGLFNDIMRLCWICHGHICTMRR